MKKIRSFCRARESERLVVCARDRRRGVKFAIARARHLSYIPYPRENSSNASQLPLGAHVAGTYYEPNTNSTFEAEESSEGAETGEARTARHRNP